MKNLLLAFISVFLGVIDSWGGITGPTSVCVNAQGQYQLSPFASTAISWSVSGDGQIVSGEGTRIIVVVWHSPGPQNVTVEYQLIKDQSSSDPPIYSASLDLTVGGPNASITSAGETVKCSNATVTLNAATGQFYTYQWYNDTGSLSGATGSSYTTSVPGNYYVIVTQSTCTSISNTISITNTTCNISGSQTVCANVSNTYTYFGRAGEDMVWNAGDGVITGAGNSVNVAWSTTGAKTVSLYFTRSQPPNQYGEPQTYHYSIPVTVSGPPNAITPSGNQTICSASTLLLAANAGTGFTYQWYNDSGLIPGATNATYEAGVGNYYASITSSGCTANTSTVSITSQNCGINGTSPLCLNQEAVFSFFGITGTNPSWDVSSGIITQVIDAKTIKVKWTDSGPQTVTYTYEQGTNQYGEPIQKSKSTSVQIDPSLSAGVVGTSQEICVGNPANILSSSTPASGSDGSYSYQWETSTNGADPWTLIPSATTDTFNPGVISSTLYYRRKVTSGCGEVAYNQPITIKVDGITQSGDLNLQATSFCSEAITNLTLSNQTGSVLSWELSARSYNGSWSGWSAWSQISTQDISQLGVSGDAQQSQKSEYQYRAKVQNGVCPSVYAFTGNPMTVYSPTNAGYVLPPITNEFCNNANVTLQAQGYAGDVVHWSSRYKDGATGSFSGWQPQASSNSSIHSFALTNSAIQNRYYQFHLVVKNGLCMGDTTQAVSTIIDAPSIAGNISGTNEGYGSINSNLVIANNLGNVSEWQSSTDGTNWLAIPNSGSETYSANVTSSANFRVSVVNGVCAASNSSPFTMIVYPIPNPIFNGAAFVGYGDHTSLVSNANYYTYQWLRNGSLMSGEDGNSVLIQRPGQYQLRVKASPTIGNYTSNVVNVGDEMDGQAVNYVRTMNFLREGIFDNTDLYRLSSSDYLQTVEYLDGHGRAIQNVSKNLSPSGKDLFQPIQYDQFNREQKKYLPIVSEDADGRYKTGTFDINGELTSNFYSDPSSKIAIDSRPFSETIFEPSPLNRVTKQGAPGTPWQPDNLNSYTSTDRTIKKAYEFNAAHEVLLWTFTPADATFPFGKINAGFAVSLTYYDANVLLKNKTKDEQHHEVIEYSDKQGRTILKRVQATGSQTINDTNYASTYYIYDDFNNLICVIPPEGTNRLSTEYYQNGATDVTKDDFLERWAFRYTYDGRKRMTMKQVPGADPVYMVYDNRDRLVMTQDGNQRMKEEWLFTKYDALNRPVLTGLYSDTVDLITMQSIVNDYYNNLAANQAWYETFIGNATGQVHGYNNYSFPQESTFSNYLTVTYYDNYDFKTLLADSSRYCFVANELSGQRKTYFKRLTGQVTGSKVKVLDGHSTWLSSVNYYDDHYRVIQTASNNFKNGIDRSTSIYDFVGKVLRTKINHVTNKLSWQDFVNVNQLGDQLSKSVTGNGWNTSGASSAQPLAASTDGWFEFSPVLANKVMAVGFSIVNTDNNWTTIKHAFYLKGNATFLVRENGTSTNLLGTALPYRAGDIFRIERKQGYINYYQNGTLLLQRTAVTDPLLADVAFNTASGSIAILGSSFGNWRQQLVSRSFVYDHANRLLETWHKVNNQDSVLLASNEYNELGQLVTKKLHSVDGGNTFKQHIDYRYNIRGWLERMNNSNLDPDDVSEPKDLFGMELAYNSNIGLTANAQFNGNISAIKWSSGLGLGNVKERGYVFNYDPLNRLTDANHQGKVTSWNSSTAFHENGISYDLNGNIQTLSRKAKDGTNMDVLSYDYGTTNTTGNKLLSVTDTGNKEEGFVDGSNTDDDYAYDANGNLVWDKNKGGDENLINGSFDNGANDWTITDTQNRLNFTTNELQITQGSTPSTLLQSVVSKGQMYVVVMDVVRTSGALNVRVGGKNTKVNTTGVKVFTVTAKANNFDFKITANKAFNGIIKSASLKGVTVISYNHLNLPEKVTRTNEQLNYVYDATGRKLVQELSKNGNVTKRTDYNNEFIYQNDTLQFINHEEGRVVMKPLSPGVTGVRPEYQYHLKDHLGNVRTTFTTKPATEQLTATFETANQNVEQSKFLRMDEARLVNAKLFDHTHTGITHYSERLSGSANEKTGIARSLSVMPGDIINLTVYAKYVDPSASNDPAMLNLLAQIIAGTASAGTVIDGANYIDNGITPFPYAGMAGEGSSSGNGPKAYLNYIMFDRDYVPILGDVTQTNYVRVSTAAKEDGTTASVTNGWGVPHEKLTALIVAKQAGYLYIYLSNEEDTPVEVYFDDLTVEQIKSPVVQVVDYYPFGLTLNSYSREKSTPQKYLYNGKELQDDLDLGWYDYGARMYDRSIARWNAIDQYASVYEENSPYSFVANDPVIGIDFEGKLIVYVNGFRTSAYVTWQAEKTLHPFRQTPPPWEHQDNWNSWDIYDYWSDFNRSWSFPDSPEKRFYVDGMSSPGSSGDERFSRGQVEGKILAEKIKSGEIKLEDGETIRLIGHSHGAGHAMGMAKGLLDSGIDPTLVQILLFAPEHPNQVPSIPGIFIMQADRNSDKIANKGWKAGLLGSQNERVGNNVEYVRLPDGDEDGRGNHGIQFYTAEQVKNANPKLYQYLIDKGIINSDGTLPQ